MRTERPSGGRGGPSLLRTERPRVCAWPHAQGDQRLVAAEVPPLSPVLRRARQASDLCDSGWKSHPRISKSARTSATTLCRGSHGNVSPQPASLQRWRPLEGPAAGGRRAPCTQRRHRAANGPAGGAARGRRGALGWGGAGLGCGREREGGAFDAGAQPGDQGGRSLQLGEAGLRGLPANHL